jgi:hypothetical protein
MGVNPGSAESLASSWVHYFCCLHFTSVIIAGGGGSLCPGIVPNVALVAANESPGASIRTRFRQFRPSAGTATLLQSAHAQVVEVRIFRGMAGLYESVPRDANCYLAADDEVNDLISGNNCGNWDK